MNKQNGTQGTLSNLYIDIFSNWYRNIPISIDEFLELLNIDWHEVTCGRLRLENVKPTTIQSS